MHILYIYIVVCTGFSNICIDKVSRTKGIITALFSDKASTFTGSIICNMCIVRLSYMQTCAPVVEVKYCNI